AGPDLLFVKEFASRGISHANKITSFHCLLCKTPSLRKKTSVFLERDRLLQEHARIRRCESLVIVNHCGLRE
ncbi:MAG: hypothetical protein IJ734_06295, partial [Fibrobacter sp.]|nr:hypothetical protein [Fibrobacter sp.]